MKLKKFALAIPGAQVVCNVAASGGISLDPNFLVEFDAAYGAHQIRLEGGDCSTDSFCYPSVGLKLQ